MSERVVVVGVGCSRGCPAGELLDLVDGTLAAAGLDAATVAALATIDARAEEPGVLSVARTRGWMLRTYAAEALAGVAVATPSAVVAAAVGTPSVAEAAALLSAGPGAELLVTKRRTGRATCAVAGGAGAPPG